MRGPGRVIFLGGAGGVADISARVYHSVDQPTATGVSLILAFNSERFDTDNIHNTVTNNSRLTCNTAGIYLIAVNISFAVSGTGGRSLLIRLNGTTLIASVEYQAPASFYTGMNVAVIYQLAPGDYVEALVQQLSGGALSVVASPQRSPEFMMVRVA